MNRQMQGHVKTPTEITDLMVEHLFNGKEPSGGDRILYPGCGGEGPFISAVTRYCIEEGLPVPEGVAFETHPDRFESVRKSHRDMPVEFRGEDFLQDSSNLGEFDYIVGNPPYVPIEKIEKKGEYRSRFETAEKRFDLYILFFEQATKVLKNGGRLCFITPEKFEYTNTAEELRRLLTTLHVDRIEHHSNNIFESHITYPAITVIENFPPEETTIVRRDGSEDKVTLPQDGSSWAPVLRDVEGEVYESDVTLGDVTKRISPGVATGRDKIFVQERDDVPSQLIEEDWVYPTTSGRQLVVNDGPHTGDVFVCPYDENGDLVDEDDLGSFRDWAEIHRSEFESRSCVENGKDWYSWHEDPPMDDVIGRPKILYRDLAKEPKFWIDEEGEVLPRHSVYYIIPEEGVDIYELKEHLESVEARVWFELHCQRAVKGYYRIQSSVIEDLPVLEKFANQIQTTIG